MMQLQLSKKPKKNWQSLRQLIRKKLLLFYLKKVNWLQINQNAANQAKAAYETAQTVANEKAVALATEAAKKKQKLQQLIFAKDSQYHQSTSVLLRFMSQKHQLQKKKFKLNKP